MLAFILEKYDLNIALSVFLTPSQGSQVCNQMSRSFQWRQFPPYLIMHITNFSRRVLLWRFQVWSHQCKLFYYHEVQSKEK